MKKLSPKITRIASITGLFLGAFALAALADTWTAPPQTAPNGNVAAPINVSVNNQVKQGHLTIGSSNPPSTSLDVYGQSEFYNDIGVLGTVAAGRLTVTNGAKTGYVLTSTDDYGVAEWRPSSSNILSAQFKMISGTDPISILPTGTHPASKVVSVPGAEIGDTVVIGLPASYHIGGGVQNICGPVTATVSSSGTVSIHFWNVYASESCNIPNGDANLYKIKVIKN